MAFLRVFEKLGILCWLCASYFAPACQAQDAADAKHFVEEASKYRFSAAGQPAFELRQPAVMVWSNPAAFDQKGAVFVWMQSGRPQVIGTLFDSVRSGMPRSAMELHSLADTAIEGQFQGTEFWQPASSGLKFEPVGNNGELATAPQRRLLQLRQIAREFSATLTNPDGSQVPLRLLPTPILTYESQSEAGASGAIFAFAATGTDPDAFLIIENRKVGGKLELQYAFARFHFRQLTAMRGGATVWTAAARTEMTRNFRGSPAIRNEPYVFFRVK